MTTENKELDDIKVSEGSDGGAVVELPDNLVVQDDEDTKERSEEHTSELQSH